MADENTSTTTETTEAPVEAPDTTAQAQGDAPEGKEAPAVDPVKARAEKIAQAVAEKMARRKAKVREGEANLARARADFDRQQAALAEQAKQLEQHRQLVVRANDGDPEAMKALGFNYDAYTEAMLKRGTPDEKIGALQKELEAERAARKAREQQEAEAQQRAYVQQAEKNFLGVIQGGDFPEASLYAPEELVATGHAVADQLARQNGQPPTLRQIAEEIERRLNERHTQIRQAGEKRKAAAEAAAAEAAKKAGKRPSTTIDNRDAGERGQPAPRELSETEKRELYAQWAREHLLSGD
jgi:hypothetical protein